MAGLLLVLLQNTNEYHKVCPKTYQTLGSFVKNDKKPIALICGEYCIVFLLQFKDFKNLQCFLDLFSQHMLENDRRVIKFEK